MSAKQFSKLDLNLLRAFLVLYQTESNTKTAEILNLSQSAVSKILQRLRDHFDDELFTRTSTGMKPTAKADELGAKLPDIIDSLAAVCEDRENFSPLELKGTVKIASIAPIIELIGAKIYQAIKIRAPELEIHLYNWSNETKQDLLAGEIDLGLNYAPLEIPKILICRPIVIDDFVLLTRHDHPMQKTDFSIEEFVKYPIATNIIPEFNHYYTLVEKTCNKQGFEIKNTLRSGQMSTLAEVIANSDTIMGATKTCSFLYQDKWRALPNVNFFDYDMTPLSVALYLHAKNRSNPKYVWLEQLIKQLILTEKSTHEQ